MIMKRVPTLVEFTAGSVLERRFQNYVYDLKPFIICPKSMIKTWFDVAEIIDIKLFGVSNYECFAKGNYYNQ